MHTHEPDREGEGTPSFLARGRWVFWAFAIAAAIFLLSEHRAHVLGVLPYLILLACPFMHLFMHHGHDGHHGGHGGQSGDARPPADKPRNWE